MNVFDMVPSGFRRLLRRALPERVAEAIRTFLLRNFNLNSMACRDPQFVVWFRRHILRRKPVLYHFEIHITDHCNLNCKGCAHFSNLCKPTFAELDAFEADMRAMASHFSAVRQIYLLGGEPLLHKDVASFVRVARDVFPDTRIYLMTNGTLVTRMNDEFWASLADTGIILLCDSYPIGLPVEEIDRLGREHGVTVEWTVQREEFFKIPIDPEGGHDPKWAFRRCQGFNNCPIVRDGKLYPCAYIAFADVFMERFGLQGLDPTPRDFVAIHEEQDAEKVFSFLRNEVPWCTHCDMDSREFYTWGRSQRKLEEWTKSA